MEVHILHATLIIVDDKDNYKVYPLKDILGIAFYIKIDRHKTA